MNTFPLSGIQKHFWAASEMNPSPSAYNIISCVQIAGKLDVKRLRDAWYRVFQSVEIFKTSFPENAEKPTARIDDHTPPPWLELSCADAEVMNVAANQFYERFDLGKAPLVRAALIETAPDRHYFILTQHHIITDPHSVKLIGETISKIYNSSRLDIPSTPYSKFVEMEQEFLNSNKGEKSIAFWKEKMESEIKTLETPCEKEHAPIFEGKGASVPWELPASLALMVQSKASSDSEQSFLWLLTAYIATLARISGQKNFSVGVPLSNRRLDGMSNVIGPFVNILPVCVDISDEDTFQSLYNKVREEIQFNRKHQEVPFVDIAGFFKGKRDLSRPSLIQAGFTLQQLFELELDGLKCTSIPIGKKGSQLDLFFTFWPTETGFSGYWEYNSGLISRQIAKEWQDSFNTLLQESLERPDNLLNTYRIASPEAVARHTDWNRTERSYPLESNLAAHLRTAFSKNQEEIALVLENREVSYREMEKLVCNAATRLHQDFGEKNRIALLLTPSAEMVLAIHSVIQSGNAYVPIDPEWPHERIRMILEDIRPAAVIAESIHNSLLSEMDLPVIESNSLSTYVAEDISYPVLNIGPDDSAYIIYTSGSTGAPKGAELPHNGVLNRILWMQDEYQLSPRDRVLQKTPYTFDVSVWEFFWPFFTGAGLVVTKPGGNRDPQYLKETIEKKHVSVLHFVPSMLSIFLNVPGVGELSSIRDVICSGEALTKGQEEKFFETFKSSRLHNLYGPTEASIDVTFWECGKKAENSYPSVPIGKPIANIKLYIVDEHGHLCPPLVNGELLIGGVGLAKGYWNRPELTAEKFIANPLGQGKLYRTGDICRYRLDGTIEYIGRMDFQVKLRGLRVELGEIERNLERHPNIEKAVVTLWHKTEIDERLVAYITTCGKAIIPADEDLKSFLGEFLPHYMIPSHIMPLSQFPINANGKLDRKALPAPDIVCKSIERSPSEDDILNDIIKLWAMILSSDSFGVDDNFFDVGGNSLMIMELSLRMEKKFNTKIKLTDLFRYPSVKGMAALINRNNGITGQDEVQKNRVLAQRKRLQALSAKNRVS